MVLFQSFQVFVFDYTGGRFSLDPAYPKRIPSSIGFNPIGAMEWADGSHILFSVQPSLYLHIILILTGFREAKNLPSMMSIGIRRRKLTKLHDISLDCQKAFAEV